MLDLVNICKSYSTNNHNIRVLDNINLSFLDNEFVSILGSSGAGKSTLLNIIGGLDKYDSGDLIINGKSTKRFKDKDFDSYRNKSIGFIFQHYNLINHMKVLDNVELSMLLSGVSKKERRKKAVIALEKVGLKNHIYKKVYQLSGGQMQRVAIARAIVNNPDIILADEPTGALDSKTSKQIMNLIKEISKDKLVIMVTHNKELAKLYSTRIIELKDGKVLSDTGNKCKMQKLNRYKLNKISMSFFTALKLSFNNILTKKGRTIITTFASSIGIIGIALILSISNGFKNQIYDFEKDTSMIMPIIINEDVLDEESENKNEKLKEYSNSKKIYSLTLEKDKIHKNNLSSKYITYIENMNNDLVYGITYRNISNINLLTKINNDIKLVDYKSIMSQKPIGLNGKNSKIIKDNYDVIYGSYSLKKEDLTLVVDSKNRVDATVLKVLGYNSKDDITFDKILNKEFKVALNNDYYNYNGINYEVNDYGDIYNKSVLTLKITSVIRGKKDNTFSDMYGTGILYNKSLMDYVIKENSKSDIVKSQKNSSYNVLTLEKNFDKNKVLSSLGVDNSSLEIQIYPKDFDSKKKILKYLDNYNKNKKYKEKILYSDKSSSYISLIKNIMDAITIVLIFFSCISLIVSSIMIGIIVYISVLERTREIGILRSLGARKKDISRVFNAETFILGFMSGILGIIISSILILPINAIAKDIIHLEKIASLKITHAIILITISIFITMTGGLIPSKIASNKRIIESLKIE